MPVTKSAKKALKVSTKKRAINAKVKKDMKVAMNIFNKKVVKGEKISGEDLSVVYSKIDKAQKKNILHKKTAARKKSGIAKAFATT